MDIVLIDEKHPTIQRILKIGKNVANDPMTGISKKKSRIFEAVDVTAGIIDYFSGTNDSRNE